MGIPRGLLVRNTDSDSPLRRKDYTFTFIDDGGRAAVEPVQDALGDILIGVPEPDSTNSSNIFVVDRIYLQAPEIGGSAGTDLLKVDVFAGPAGTSMCSTLAQVAYHASAAAPMLAQIGGATASGVTHPVLKTTSGACEVAAGKGVYIDLTAVNASTTPFGACTVIVSGYFKDEF